MKGSSCPQKRALKINESKETSRRTAWRTQAKIHFNKSQKRGRNGKEQCWSLRAEQPLKDQAKAVKREGSL